MTEADRAYIEKALGLVIDRLRGAEAKASEAAAHYREQDPRASAAYEVGALQSIIRHEAHAVETLLKAFVARPVAGRGRRRAA